MSFMRMNKSVPYWLTLLVLVIIINCAHGCRKSPSVPHGRKKRGDNGYRLFIADEPDGYEPGKIYNLFLIGSRTHENLQQFSHFMVTAQAANELKNKRMTVSTAGPRRVGRFQLFSDSLAKFSENCVNTVSESDDLLKSEIQVLWVAPATGSGCVALSAMVYESPSSWFAEEDQLKKIICEKKPEKKNEALECCACDEAKYNFVFEGIWSNETHPKDYPFAIWLTHFSDVIGASHDQNFSFWGENHIATDGFRSLAEWGSVRLLEVELRAKAPRLKTLIKSAGLWYPEVNTNTSSHFRVDRKKYKVSLVSMFGPSPDWVVGVNGLNLCRPDCTWTESIDIDLFPWDSGTDSGISYMSANVETQPREKMRRITTMYPEDPRAPFYNPTQREMLPLAKLYIRREKVISRPCDFDLSQTLALDDTENSEGPVRPECETTEYTNWTPCSVTCGKGIRTRSRNYVSEGVARDSGCNRQLISREMCVSDVAECTDTDSQDDDDDDSLLGTDGATTNDRGEGIGICKTTVWSEWSPCSATCGAGITMRTRYFIDHMGIKKCPHVTIVEKQKCMTPECSAADIEAPDPLCPVGQWSDWSPCSVSCGSGVTIRKRLLHVEPDMTEVCSQRLKLDEQRSCVQKQDCAWDEQTSRANCILDKDDGPCRGNFNRFFYDKNVGNCVKFIYRGCRGNLNNFLTYDECIGACGILKRELPSVSQVSAEIIPARSQEECSLSEWSPWTTCNVSCGVGRQISRRYVLSGSQCNTQPRLMKHRKCYTAPCN